MNLRRLPSPALVPMAAAVWWIAGFLPWIVGRLREDRYDETDISWPASPLISTYLGDLVLYAGVGGVLAGTTVLLSRDSRARSALFVAVGVVLAAVIVLAHSRSAVDASDERLVNGLTVIGFVATLAGLGAGLLASVNRVGAGIVLGFLAGSVPIWFTNLGVVSGTIDPGTGNAGRWIGAAVLVAALVVIGARPLVRWVSWPVAILVAWFVAPTVTALGYLGGQLRPGIDSPGALGDGFSASLDVWRMASSLDLRPLTPWIVALVVALGIVCAREVAERSSR